MSENKSDGSRRTWEDIGKGAAAQIKKTARKVPHIEARGYLCHELTYLLGGCVAFTETPMSKFRGLYTYLTQSDLSVIRAHGKDRPPKATV